MVPVFVATEAAEHKATACIDVKGCINFMNYLQGHLLRAHVGLLGLKNRQ